MRNTRSTGRWLRRHRKESCCRFGKRFRTLHSRSRLGGEQGRSCSTCRCESRIYRYASHHTRRRIWHSFGKPRFRRGCKRSTLPLPLEHTLCKYGLVPNSNYTLRKRRCFPGRCSTLPSTAIGCSWIRRERKETFFEKKQVYFFLGERNELFSRTWGRRERKRPWFGSK